MFKHDSAAFALLGGDTENYSCILMDTLPHKPTTKLFCALQAEKVDAALHSLLMKLEPQRQHLACLGTWILYHNLRIMIQYLLSGFELELYSMHEYYYIYW